MFRFFFILLVCLYSVYKVASAASIQPLLSDLGLSDVDVCACPFPKEEKQDVIDGKSFASFADVWIESDFAKERAINSTDVCGANNLSNDQWFIKQHFAFSKIPFEEGDLFLTAQENFFQKRPAFQEKRKPTSCMTTYWQKVHGFILWKKSQNDVSKKHNFFQKSLWKKLFIKSFYNPLSSPKPTIFFLKNQKNSLDEVLWSMLQ